MKAHGLRVGHSHPQSYSQLCSAPPCLMVVMLHDPREAETGPSMLYHPTAAMKVAQGPRPLSSISASHAKLLAQGHAHVLGSGCTAAWKMVERTLSTSSSPCASLCDTQALNQHMAFLTANQCCGSIDLWFCCVNPNGRVIASFFTAVMTMNYFKN